MEKGYIGVATKSALSVAHCVSGKQKRKRKKKKKKKKKKKRFPQLIDKSEIPNMII